MKPFILFLVLSASAIAQTLVGHLNDIRFELTYHPGSQWVADLTTTTGETVAEFPGYTNAEPWMQGSSFDRGSFAVPPLITSTDTLRMWSNYSDYTHNVTVLVNGQLVRFYAIPEPSALLLSISSLSLFFRRRRISIIKPPASL